MKVGDLRREHQAMRRGMPATTRPHLQREKTTETSQGVLAGKRLAPRVETSSKPFVTRETTISPLAPQTAAPTGSTLEWKDVVRQADALFMRGEYEQALVWYHRGRRLRPKAKEFQNGIVKCERAINNRCAYGQTTPLAFGRDSIVTDTSSGGDSPPRSRASTRNTTYSATQRTTRSLPTPQQVSVRSGGSSTTPMSPWVTESEGDAETSTDDRKHIRKLKRDRMYLKDLLREMDTNVSKSSDVQNIVEQSLKYLDTRTKFWKQNLPMHALRNMQTRSFQFPVASLGVRDDSSLPSVSAGSRMNKANSSNVNHYILREVFKVHQDFLDERYKECVGRAERCIQTVQIHKASEVSRKYEIVANLYALKGNSHFQLEQYKEALRCYHRDLEISKEKDMTESKSRALENIGRVYARIGEFDKAVNVWKEKSALCRSDSERAWLYHEIGYCYLSKREYSKAKQFGEMAYASAEHTGDMIWQLNASTLIAQAEARMTELQNSHDTFKYALDLAKLIGDREEQTNIEEAMASIKLTINEQKEERRRKLIETRSARHRDKHAHSLPHGMVLTDEDLMVDEEVYRDSPELDPEGGSSPNYQVPKGAKLRRRLYGSSEFTPAVMRKPESSQDNLSLTGGTISLKNRQKSQENRLERGLTDGEMVQMHTSDLFENDDVTFSRPANLKSILKNTAYNTINIWSDLDSAQSKDSNNPNLLPAIARSNTQIGFVKPEIGQSHNHNVQPMGVSHRVRDYQASTDAPEKATPKSVRFKEENELFRLPEIPPPPSESTVASEPEEIEAPKFLRAVLETEGYFIGKYA